MVKWNTAYSYFYKYIVTIQKTNSSILHGRSSFVYISTTSLLRGGGGGRKSLINLLYFNTIKYFTLLQMFRHLGCLPLCFVDLGWSGVKLISSNVCGTFNAKRNLQNRNKLEYMLKKYRCVTDNLLLLRQTCFWYVIDS